MLRLSKTASWIPASLLVLIASLVISAAALALYRPDYLDPTSSFSTISSDYAPIVQDILRGLPYSAFRFPPLTALSLAFTTQLAHTVGLSDRVLLAAFMALMVAIGSVLLYRIMRSLWSAWASAIAIVLWMLYIPALYLSLYVGSEQIFNAFLFASALLFLKGNTDVTRHRWTLLFGSGLCAGLAMLTRSTGIGLLVILPALWLWKSTARPAWKGTAALLIGIGLIVLPWEIYAYGQTHMIVPLSTSGPGALIDGATYAVDPKDHRNIAITDADRALQLDFYKIPRGQVATLSQIASFFVTEFRAHPNAVIEHFATKFVSIWYATDGSRLSIAFLPVQFPYMLLFAASFVLGFRQTGLRRRMTLLIAVFGLYILGMTILMVPLVRYLIPAIGLTFTLVPVTLETAVAAIRRRRSAAALALRGHSSEPG